MVSDQNSIKYTPYNESKNKNGIQIYKLYFNTLTNDVE